MVAEMRLTGPIACGGDRYCVDLPVAQRAIADRGSDEST